jgi:hypothetical protein
MGRCARSRDRLGIAAGRGCRAPSRAVASACNVVSPLATRWKKSLTISASVMVSCGTMRSEEPGALLIKVVNLAESGRRRTDLQRQRGSGRVPCAR